ncbi:hypothetical protein WJX73_003586 [Symbiochloris irregularis]|uniref:TF-B3 domain-containing protein n=1 Tax=Symbiochloris irregularis TaxID=706552 RepID=A0AAW1PF88_9CHLO
MCAIRPLASISLVQGIYCPEDCRCLAIFFAFGQSGSVCPARRRWSRSMASTSKRFVKKVPSSGVAPIYKLSLPHKFVQAHLADAVGANFEIASACDLGRSWHASIISRRNRDRQEFCLKGWKLFAEAHAVQAGDQFSFELIGDRQLVITLLTRAADGPPSLAAAGHTRTRSAAAHRKSTESDDTDMPPPSPTGSPATVQDSGPDSLSSMGGDYSSKLQDNDANAGSALTEAALQPQKDVLHSAFSMSGTTMDVDSLQVLDEMPEATMVILLKAVVADHKSLDRQVPCSSVSSPTGHRHNGNHLMGRGSASPIDSLQLSGTIMSTADLNVSPLYSTPLPSQLLGGAVNMPKSDMLGQWAMPEIPGSIKGLHDDAAQTSYKKARRATVRPHRLRSDV